MRNTTHSVLEKSVVLGFAQLDKCQDEFGFFFPLNLLQKMSVKHRYLFNYYYNNYYF